MSVVAGTLGTKRFYGSRSTSSVSTCATDSTTPTSSARHQSKRKRIDLEKAICVSNDVELSDPELDLSDSDFFGESDPPDPTGPDTEDSFNSSHSSQMYSFSTSTPRSTPVNSAAGSAYREVTRTDDNYLADLIQRQNDLILELLKKQEGLTEAIEEVKTDLKETRSHVDELVDARQKKQLDASNKSKRKYPSTLTVCAMCTHSS